MTYISLQELSIFSQEKIQCKMDTKKTVHKLRKKNKTKNLLGCSKCITHCHTMEFKYMVKTSSILLNVQPHHLIYWIPFLLKYQSLQIALIFLCKQNTRNKSLRHLPPEIHFVRLGGI